MRRELPGKTDLARLAGAICAVLCLVLPESSEGGTELGYTLVGTCLARGEEMTPIPGVLVLLHPDSTRAATDEAGDFILQWSGEPGWITFTVPGGGLTGDDWCMRTLLQPPSAYREGLFVDLGKIRMTPGRRTFSTGVQLPAGASPEQIPPVAGPAEGDNPDGTVRYRLTTDIHGIVVETEVVGSEAPPDIIAAAIEEWIRSFPWAVGHQSTCDDDHPFSGDIRLGYIWKDGLWRFGRAEDRPDRGIRR